MYDIVIPTSTKPGIYMLYNISKKKAYIGKAKNLKKRAESHKCLLHSNKHGNKKLQEDYNNGDRFVLVVLEVLADNYKPEDLTLKERQYIFAFYDKSVDMYNAETKEQIWNLLIADMVLPQIRATQKHCAKRMGVQIGYLKYCVPGTLTGICDLV